MNSGTQEKHNTLIKLILTNFHDVFEIENGILGSTEHTLSRPPDAPKCNLLFRLAFQWISIISN